MNANEQADLLKEIGARALACRLGLGLTQVEVARRVGCNQSAIARIEVGGSALPVTRLVELADALETTIGDLLHAAHRASLPLATITPFRVVTTTHVLACAECGEVGEYADPVAARTARVEHATTHRSNQPPVPKES